jgi:hypothetical protein
MPIREYSMKYKGPARAELAKGTREIANGNEARVGRVKLS